MIVSVAGAGGTCFFVFTNRQVMSSPSCNSLKSTLGPVALPRLAPTPVQVTEVLHSSLSELPGVELASVTVGVSPALSGNTLDSPFFRSKLPPGPLNVNVVELSGFPSVPTACLRIVSLGSIWLVNLQVTLSPIAIPDSVAVRSLLFGVSVTPFPSPLTHSTLANVQPLGSAPSVMT